MARPCKVMIVERESVSPLRERLLAQYGIDFSVHRSASECELRELAREFAPDVVLSTDNLPAVQDSQLKILNLLSRHPPELMICEVGSGNEPRWAPDEFPTATSQPSPSAVTAKAASKVFSVARALPKLFEQSTDAVVVVDSDGYLGFANPSACRLLARRFSGPLGTFLASDMDAQRRIWADEVRAPKVINLQVERSRCVHGLVAFEEATRMATRIHLEDLVAEKTACGQHFRGSLPVVALDLNGIQLLNDAYGRSMGEEVFRLISQVVQPQYARCGLLAHLGGDQYLFVLPHASDAADAAVAVQGLRPRSMEYANTDRFQLYDEPAANDVPVLREALARKRPLEKAAVSGQIKVSGAPPTVTIHRRAINIHFQPQFEISSGAGSGMEALARWTLSNGEVLLPGSFIPVAERSGMIGRLGAAILEDACAAAAGWRGREAEQLTLSVNLSASQIRRDYTRTLTETLKRRAFPAKRLELEIDEAALTGLRSETLACIKEWRQMGVRIAVNHAGSDYSSLSYLSHLRIDRLKLDRGLVRRAVENRRVASFVHAVIALGREFDVDVVGQGVETTAQLNLLRDIGCRYAQGFLLARPMPVVQAQLALRKPYGNLPRAELANAMAGAPLH